MRRVRYEGQRSKGITAPMVDYQAKLLEDLSASLTRLQAPSEIFSRLCLPVAPSNAPSVGKIGSREANYTDKGPYPMVCGNCKFIVWGQMDDGEYDYCQIVEGSHPEGGIYPKGSCRYFQAKEFFGGAK